MLLEHAEHLLDDRPHVRIDRHPERGARAAGHPQRPRLAPERRRERLLRSREVVAVAGGGPAERVQQRRAVADGAGERELVREPADRLPHGGADRYPAPRRLQPDQAAPAGGNADRPAAVVAVAHRQSARGDQRGGAATGAAGAARRVPGVERGTVDDRGRVDVEGELGCGASAPATPGRRCESAPRGSPPAAPRSRRADGVPNPSRRPASGSVSLTANGTPANGPSSGWGASS